MMETSPSPSALPFSVQPRVETSWLALPLSARGLIDELAKYADENARIIVRLVQGADISAIGKEIARLLCAHPGELARVRSDTKRLMADGFLAVDGAALRLSRIAHETARSVERSEAMTEAERSRRYRENQKLLREAELESSRNVARVTEDRDDLRDDRHVTSVTRALSFKDDLDLKSLKEREAVTQVVTTGRAAPETINEARRANAKQLGLQDHRVDLVWRQFTLHFRVKRKSEHEWDNLWAEWVTRRLVWDSEKLPKPKAAAQPFDHNATWLRQARGET